MGLRSAVADTYNLEGMDSDRVDVIKQLKRQEDITHQIHGVDTYNLDDLALDLLTDLPFPRPVPSLTNITKTYSKRPIATISSVTPPPSPPATSPVLHPLLHPKTPPPATNTRDNYQAQ